MPAFMMGEYSKYSRLPSMPPLILLVSMALSAQAAIPPLTDKQQEGIENARPLDWAELAKDGDVVYVGEHHPIKAEKLEFAAHLDAFKKAGFTHLALEMFHKGKQKLLDDFCKEEACAKDVAKQLDEEWCWRDATGAYVELVEKAKKLGFKLVALDVPVKEQVQWMDAAVKHADTSAELSGHLRSMLERRDGQMAAAIAGVFKDDPKARVVAYVGVYHAQFTTQVAALEAWDVPLKDGGERKLAVKGYCFINIPTGLQLRWAVPLMVRAGKLEPLFIPLARERSDWKTYSECDGMLAVPVVLAEQPSTDPDLVRCAPAR